VPNLSRRELGLLGMGALAIGAFGADTAVTTAEADMVERPARLASRVGFLQVVAHPDDDLYFMNPDIADSVRTGGEVTTVVLTAAEAGGGASFAAARQHGLRSAYARMAGVEDDAPWRRSMLVTRGGEAELCELAADSRIRLVFLDISMGAYTGSTPGDENHTPLAALFHGTETTRPVLQPSESAITGGVYTRDQLVGTLTDLMDRFLPTVVRTMDPDPERRGAGPKERAWLTDSGVHTDNEDHTAAAWFTYAAYADHRARRGPSAVRLDSYVGYGNARWRHNLGGSSAREKLRLLGVYGWADQRKCGDPVGCGDRTVAGDAARPGWSQSTNLRHVGTTDWLGTGPDGRLRAFAAVGGRAVVWTETSRGSGKFRPGAGVDSTRGVGFLTLPGSVDVGGIPGLRGGQGSQGKQRNQQNPDENTASSLTPHLVVAVDASRRAHLVGLRATTDPDRGTWTQEVVVCNERTDGSFTPWTSLGTPTGEKTEDCQAVGCPTAAVDGRGVLHVFARNADMSVSWCHRDLTKPGTRWSGWRDIGGHRVRDGLTAAVTHDGDIELHAVGYMLWTWRIGASGEPRPTHAPLPPMGDPPTVHMVRGGGALLAARAADSGALTVLSRPSGGTWRAGEGDIVLGGQGGFGVVAIQPHAGGVFLAQRGQRGLVEVVWQPQVGVPGGVRRWLSGPGPILHPSLTVDAHGRIVVAAIGPEGALYTAWIDTGDPPRTLQWQSSALA
jgi:LmbE family N-acetylglucosaminyl deacetylase